MSEVSVTDELSEVEVDALLETILAVPCSVLVVAWVELGVLFVVVVVWLDVLVSEVDELSPCVEGVCGPVLPPLDVVAGAVVVELVELAPLDVTGSLVEPDVWVSVCVGPFAEAQLMVVMATNQGVNIFMAPAFSQAHFWPAARSN